MGFRYDIQGLRALAVLLVFIFHLNPAMLSGGFIGVDVFFVISGYLVSGIILYKKDNATFSFKDFYISRIKRIIPVFYVFLIFVAISGLYVYIGHDIKVLKRSLLHSIVFNSNNYFASISDYFGASSQQNPLLHTWTLSLEMQFYFLLPLFLILLKRKWIFPISISLILVLLGYSFFNSTFLSNQSQMYFSLYSRIPEFLLGVVFSIRSEFFQKFYGDKVNIYSFVSILGLIAFAFILNENFNFPGLWVIFPCIFTCILLTSNGSFVNRFLSNKYLVHIGELSYSIYLWHWALMAYFRYFYSRNIFDWKESLIIIVLSYLLSYLSYIAIENRLRKFTNLRFIFSFLPMFLFLLLIVNFLPRLGTSIQKEIPEKYATATFGLSSHDGNFKEVQILGNLNSRYDSICLIGDSHALSYKAFFDEIGLRNNLKVKTISRNVFPLIGNFDRKEFSNVKDFHDYNRLQKISDELVKNSKYIFISSEWKSQVSSFEEVFTSFVNNLREDQLVIIVGDYPLFDKNFIQVNRSVLKKDNKIVLNGKVKILPKFIQDAIDSSKQVVYMPLEYKRLENTLPYINDTIAYFDGTHLNAYGSRKLAAFFEEDVRSFLLEQGIIQEK